MAIHVIADEVTHVNILAALRDECQLRERYKTADGVLTSNICPSVVASGQDQTSGGARRRLRTYTG